MAVDIETTGLGRDARIIELGAVRIRHGRKVASYSQLVNPQIPIPAKVTQITGNEPDQQERGSVTGRALTVEWMKDPLYVDAEHPNTRWIESWYDPKA